MYNWIGCRNVCVCVRVFMRVGLKPWRKTSYSVNFWAVNHVSTSDHIIWLTLQTKIWLISIKFIPKTQSFWGAKWFVGTCFIHLHGRKSEIQPWGIFLQNVVPTYQTAVQCHNSEDHSNNELLYFLSPLLDFDEAWYTFLLHRSCHV